MQPKLLTAKVGPLTVRLIDVDRPVGSDAPPPPRALVVLCHGYGAPGHDLVGIGAEMLSTRPELVGRVLFAFPEAPLAVQGGGRAWWQIDIGRFQRAAMTGDIAKLLDEVPEGLPAARKALQASVEELVRATGLPMSHVVLGGFSQGAMVSTDLGLRLEEAPAALAIMSGTLINRPEWSKLADKRRGLHVLQSHGTSDPILPYAAALELQKLLEGAGLLVDFTPFAGGHGIDGAVVEKLSALVATVAA